MSVCVCVRLGSTLSAQSVPSVFPPQQGLRAPGYGGPGGPGGLADSGATPLLLPLKPSPSSENFYSAYTSEAALSVPSLCAPTPGTTCAASPRLHPQIGRAHV